MVASEAAPFIKTGGLADVLGGLPPALAKLGHEIAVILPKYRKVEAPGAERIYHELPVWLGNRQYMASIDRLVDRGVAYLFVHCPSLYDREGIYNVGNHDYGDNHIRFAVFCRAAMEVVRRIFRAQVMHLHDWQAALVATYLKHTFRTDPTFFGIKTLITIHNLGYQGVFKVAQGYEIGLDAALLAPAAPLESYGDLNLLKGGLIFADAINTVSKAYAREIQTSEFGFGLDGLLRSRSSVLTGILNGVDYTEWNPEHDPFIPRNFSSDTLDGKRECKRLLLEEFGLPADQQERPLIGIVSRFAEQKGFDLIAAIAGQLVHEDMSLVVLGSGNPAYESMFRELAATFPHKVGIRVGYDNPLAHRIEAGSDMFLMPSHYEPCGLNQIYSLRYGTIPIVRATGGLDDTISEGAGFKFWGYTGPELLECIRVALAAYQKRDEWSAMMRRCMSLDFSWDVSAEDYSSLYRSLLKSPAGSAAA